MKGLVKIILFIIILFVGVLIVIKSLEYAHPDFSTGFIASKKKVFDGIFKWGLYGHIILTPILLLISSILIFFSLEKKYKKTHRILGVFYVFVVLFLDGPCSFILAINANTLGAVIPFILLTLLWMFYTFKALMFAKKKDFKKHQQMMTRSYLLLISAILLRIYGYIAVVHLETYDYVTIVWLSWVPQLFVYEVLILRRKLK